VGIEEIRSLDVFLERAQKYIAYEEKQMAADVRKPLTKMKLVPLDEEQKEEKKRCENLRLHHANSLPILR
jgi:predicted transport protein